MDDERDRLIDVLLAGEIGGDRAPDLSARIVSRTSGRRVLRWGLAAAAVLLLVLGTAAWMTRYPEPRLEGEATVAGAPQLQRGASVRSGNAPATLVLGGYCRVRLEPGSEVTLEGSRGQEAVFLGSGEINCDIEPNHGAFTVRSTVGTVEVKGTSFTVRIVQEKGDDNMFYSRMVVRVLVGAVLLSGAGSQAIVHAGDEATLPRAKAEDGGAPKPVTHKTGGVISKIDGNSITVAAQGDGAAKESTVTADDKTQIMIPTGETDNVQGEGGKVIQRPKMARGKLADLKVGQRIFAVCREDNSAIRITVVTAEK